ncbi:hypothetical protein [Streptomyces sp. B1I3]|uniref:hypothetical protein n=1 Tax=Streptomyces sp. B1I3 TaxID=3042264 RepID=UPI002789AD4F|nr:hypothetical protein [Streptomyces sp. B1I3]MDQ0791960.1 hypothetical protein [Streptomyces sp. B1I3]
MAANSRTTARKTATRPVRTVREAAPAEAEVREDTGLSPADAQEIEAEGHYLSADLCGEELDIVPSGAWRQTTMRKLNNNQMDAFMEDVLSPESYELYLELDPTNAELGDFISAASETSGEPVGKSGGPSRSSRRTRRR